jgi:hypothetical protein
MTETIAAGSAAGQARYLFSHVGRKRDRGANLLAAEGIGGREVFPLILDVRNVLRCNGVPIRSGAALPGAASFCGAAAGGCRLR